MGWRGDLLGKTFQLKTDRKREKKEGLRASQAVFSRPPAPPPPSVLPLRSLCPRSFPLLSLLRSPVTPEQRIDIQSRTPLAAG